MGNKLLLDSNDPFFEPDRVAVAGVAGSCYCCMQQIHVPFQNVEDLPLAKINKENFYVLICDQCEEDITVLSESGVAKVSYDILWAIQETLEQNLYYLEEKNGGVSSIERDDLLISLYKEIENKLVNKKNNKYIDSLTEEEIENESKPKKSSKKDN